MSDEHSDEEIRKWHRRFAAQCNNRAWRLSEAQTRSATDDTEMLNAAHAAAFHWSKVGTEIHAARADMLLGHVYALLGHAGPAMHYARASFTNVSARESPDWEVALGHAVLANAASAAKNTELHSRHYALAKKIGQALSNAEEREIFEATFCRVPAPAAAKG
jgi:hypothetical protein